MQKHGPPATSQGLESLPDWLRGSKALLKALDDDVHGGAHEPTTLAEGVEIVTRWRGLAERYINGEIGVRFECHAPFPTPDSECCDLAFVFQVAIPNDQHPAQFRSGWKVELGAGIGGPGRGDVKPSVPVFARQVVEDGEAVEHESRAVVRPIRSLVRLYRLDNPSTPAREWLDLPGFSLEILQGETDRKFQFVFVGWRILPGFVDGSLVNAAIKGGSKLVEHLSQLKAQDRRERVVPWVNADGACPVIFYTNDNLIGLIFEKAIPRLSENLSVSLCSLKALSATGECPHDE